MPSIGPITAPFVYRTYRAMAMDIPGLVSYWRLGEPSGTVAADQMSRNPGSYVATPTLGAAGALAGDPDAAATFNGSTQWVYITPATNLSMTTAVSVACWVKGTANGNNQRIFSRATAPSTFLGYELKANLTTGYAVFSCGDGSTTTYSFGGVVNILDGAWHFVVGVRDGNAGYLYIDNVATGSGGNPASTFFTTVGSMAGTADAYIGRYAPSSAGFLNGTADEVMVFNRGITAAEVAALYARGLAAG